MQTEFSHPVRAGHIHAEPQNFRIAADADTRAALAVRFGLPAIAALTGDFTLSHAGAGVIAAQLVMRARVTQTCVITLEPFDAVLDEHVELRFVPAEKLDEAAELAPDSLEGPDEIPYTGDALELGEACAEQLALALDPYPRKPGAALPPEAADDGANPFAALKGRFGKLS